MTNVGRDREALAGMAKVARQAMGRDHLLVLADCGCFAGTSSVSRFGSTRHAGPLQGTCPHFRNVLFSLYQP